jgi:hypothetical protein
VAPKSLTVEYDAMVEKPLIASFSLNLENYTSDTTRSVLYMKIASDSWLRTEIDKKDDFNFPIVSFPFIFSNSPAARAYELHNFQLSLWFLSELVWVGLLLTRNLLNQGFIVINFDSFTLANRAWQPVVGLQLLITHLISSNVSYITLASGNVLNTSGFCLC